MYGLNTAKLVFQDPAYLLRTISKESLADGLPLPNDKKHTDLEALGVGSACQNMLILIQNMTPLQLQLRTR